MSSTWSRDIAVDNVTEALLEVIDYTIVSTTIFAMGWLHILVIRDCRWLSPSCLWNIVDSANKLWEMISGLRWCISPGLNESTCRSTMMKTETYSKHLWATKTLIKMNCKFSIFGKRRWRLRCMSSLQSNRSQCADRALAGAHSIPNLILNCDTVCNNSSTAPPEAPLGLASNLLNETYTLWRHCLPETPPPAN
jgi:hypothetical protein